MGGGWGVGWGVVGRWWGGGEEVAGGWREVGGV